MQITGTHRQTCVGALLLLVTTLGCSDKPPSEEVQYIRNPNPGRIEPFCRWEEEPRAADGRVTHAIGASAPLGDRASCEDFPATEVDELLEEEYLNSVVDNCDPEPFELLRGCFDHNGDRCAFSAYVFSPCPLSASSG
jgi:hypothetical protein